jgi:hypothetical protein
MKTARESLQEVFLQYIKEVDQIMLLLGYDKNLFGKYVDLYVMALNLGIQPKELLSN